jgi:hypothetical protein
MASESLKPRFFSTAGVNPEQLTDAEVEVELRTSLTRTVREIPPQDKWTAPVKDEEIGGLYSGPTGLAYVSPLAAPLTLDHPPALTRLASSS